MTHSWTCRVGPLALLLVSFLGASGTVHAEEAPPRGLRVDYDPPRLSVEARGASLAAVLSEIGARVGFSVVETAPSSVAVTLSVRDASLDDVLRQLLRAENHTVYYRPGADAAPQTSEGIERIELSGEPSAAPAVASSGPTQERLQRDQPRGPSGDGTSSSATGRLAATPPAALVPEPDALSRVAADLASAPANADDPAAPPLTVGDLLKAHAMAAAPGTSLANPQASPAPTPSPPASPDAALAETTRRAQQALGALMQALATATRSLQEPASASGR
jgi:hypothetical protein